MSIEQSYRRSRAAWRPRLAPWQWLVILVVALPLLTVLLLLLRAATQGPQTLGTGFVLDHDVPAGYSLQAADYKPMALTYAPSAFAYLTSDPAGRIVAKPLHMNTLLSPDDLLPVGAHMTRVAINLTNPPPIAPTDQIDLWVVFGNSEVRVGEHIAVDGVGPLTIKVPSGDAGYWLSLVQSKLPMYADVTTDTSDTQQQQQVNVCAALKKLGGVDCTATGTPTQGP
jgi:hypothetical protein